MKRTLGHTILTSAPTQGRSEQTLSKNEMESLCQKAAHGAGLAWGMAQEAGVAVRWLETRGFNGAAALVELLDLGEGCWDALTPRLQSGEWHGRSKTSSLCPIAFGTAFCDFIGCLEASIATHPRRSLPPLHCPVLLLPFLSLAAVKRNHSLQVSNHLGNTIITPDGHVYGSPVDMPLLSNARIGTVNAELPLVQPSKPALQITSNTWNRLQHYAMRSTVPASATSRSGAGAATSDND